MHSAHTIKHLHTIVALIVTRHTTTPPPRLCVFRTRVNTGAGRAPPSRTPAALVYSGGDGGGGGTTVLLRWSAGCLHLCVCVCVRPSPVNPIPKRFVGLIDNISVHRTARPPIGELHQQPHTVRRRPSTLPCHLILFINDSVIVCVCVCRNESLSCAAAAATTHPPPQTPPKRWSAICQHPPEEPFPWPDHVAGNDLSVLRSHPKTLQEQLA